MLVAPIKSLAFNLRHQVFVNTFHFTGFDNKMDTSMDSVIETVVQKLGCREAKNLQTKSIKEFVSGSDVFVSVPILAFISAFSSVNTFLRSFEFDNSAPHRRQPTDLVEDSDAIRYVKTISLTSYVINSHIPLAQLFIVSPDSFLRVGRTRLTLQ